ncbi:hypothetical protein [Moorena sp. SIO1G6]|uniref:hypothetical protein n=1 Tax=Moorena sp. SIO1G6 TaxID=2607840 RepID=UPI00257A503A|nr:hypothetical protein [Moorena sp. SIO1G6]
MNTTERKTEKKMEVPRTTSEVIRIKPQQFIHVLDNNTGVTRLEVGPQTITLRDHERLILKPEPMIIVPPRYYCVVANPLLRDEDGQPIADQHGQIRLRYGDLEIRFAQDPFPLYPNEKLVGDLTLPVLLGRGVSKAENIAIESTGQATAEARAKEYS